MDEQRDDHSCDDCYEKDSPGVEPKSDHSHHFAHLQYGHFDILIYDVSSHSLYINGAVSIAPDPVVKEDYDRNGSLRLRERDS